MHSSSPLFLNSTTSQLLSNPSQREEDQFKIDENLMNKIRNLPLIEDKNLGKKQKKFYFLWNNFVYENEFLHDSDESAEEIVGKFWFEKKREILEGDFLEEMTNFMVELMNKNEISAFFFAKMVGEYGKR